MPTSDQNAWLLNALQLDVSAYPSNAAGGGSSQSGGVAVDNGKLLTARKVWLATRSKVEGDIEKLRKSIAAAYKGHSDAQDLEDAFVARVEPVLGKLDDSLAHKLDAICQANGADRSKLVDEARMIISNYEKFLDGDDVVDHLDRNPLVPLAIRSTLDKSIQSLSAALG